jgi:cycloeucalenol cycloisomerase
VTWLAADPAKRAMERRVLTYSLIWIAVVVVLMARHPFSRWGDGSHLALGLGLALPLWILPFVGERERPLAERYATRFTVWIGMFSLLQCYFGSAPFFDVLGMEYHFPVTWVVHRTPVFLYFMTVAYFSTYYVVMSVLWRATGRRWLLLPLLGFGVAFAETASMANPLMVPWFFYRDKTFALTWGSIVYGTIFVLSLPFVFRIDEEPGAPRPRLRALALEVCGVTMVALVAYEVYSTILR